jgi:hypothetical protein
MLLRLAVNRLAQAAIVAPRALATRIPFAPESGRPGAGHKEGLYLGTNRLLADIRDRATTVFAEAPPERLAQGRPGTSLIQDDPAGSNQPLANQPAAADRSSAAPRDQ